jgi:acyl-CoA dehydrogenase
MDFEPSEEQRMIAQTVRAFVQKEMIPLEATYATDEGLPPDAMAELQQRVKNLGFWAIDVPVEHGGGGQDNVGTTLVNIEILQCLFPFYQPQRVFGIGGTGVSGIGHPLWHATEEQKQKYLYPLLRGEMESCLALTEPDHGSDASYLETRAVRDGDNYIINGRKTFISFAERSDICMVVAQVDPSKGAKGMDAIIVEKGTPGYSIVREIPTLGTFAPCELLFEDVVVPVTNRIGEPGKGLEIALKWIDSERLLAGAYCVGRGLRLLEMMMDYAERRVTFGEPLINRQAVQFMIADSAMESHTLRWATMYTAWKTDRGMDTRSEENLVKAMAGEAVNRIADRAIQVHGGYGVTKDLPLERIYREARVFRIWDGASEIQRVQLVKGLRKGWRP